MPYSCVDGNVGLTEAKKKQKVEKSIVVSSTKGEILVSYYFIEASKVHRKRLVLRNIQLIFILKQYRSTANAFQFNDAFCISIPVYQSPSIDYLE